MKLSFDKDEFKYWVDTVLAFGLYKAIIENKNNLLSFSVFFIIGIMAQVLALILVPISLIIVLLTAVKIK